MHLILRCFLVHPIDPFAEDRSLYGQSLFEAVIGRNGRLPLQRQRHAPSPQHIVGYADEIEGPGQTDVRHGLIQNLLHLDGRHAAVERRVEQRAVDPLRLQGDRRSEKGHSARPLVEFSVTQHLVEGEIADDLRQFGIALFQLRLACRQQRIEIAERRPGHPAAEFLRPGGRRCILRVVHRFEPPILVGLRIGLDGQMRKPAVGCRSVPVLHVGSDLHHISRQQQPRRFTPFLIIAPAGRDKQQLPSGMAMPVVAASGTESHVRHRTVQRLVAHQRRTVGLTDKIGRKFLRQLLALREDLPKDRILSHRVFLCMNCSCRTDQQCKNDCLPTCDSSHRLFVFRFTMQNYGDSALHDLHGLRISLPLLPIRPTSHCGRQEANFPYGV